MTADIDPRLLKRLQEAMAGLDLGRSLQLLATDPLAAINAAMTEIGAARIVAVDEDQVRRAVRAMEAA